MIHKAKADNDIHDQGKDYQVLSPFSLQVKFVCLDNNDSRSSLAGIVKS